ncbi:hypothetical protein EW145_g7724 [Phellinidium pouzarii]|uniref:ACB domain-containing protein n=1 Tax=Phellinidium pouzarii TaxID=167371 RepID=A0A4V6S0X1_9AGAM|nr:hypothetical protein EW145_g7724 [Phellinidium pouzarii]
MSTSTNFEKAVSIVTGLPKDGPIKPTDEEKLYFYKYFKQGTVGDINTDRPGMLDFVGKAKWVAWKSVQGTSEEEAQKLYVEKLLEILRKADDDESKKYIDALNKINP